MTLVLVNLALLASGGLLADQAPRPGLLVAEAEVAAPNVQPPAPALLPLEQMTVAQLTAERQRILDSRPSAVLPVTVMVVGAVGFSVGLGFFLFSSMVVGGVFIGVSAAVFVVGLVLYLMKGPERAENATALRKVEQALRVAKSRDDDRSVPPPPAPPGVDLGPRPGALLARF
ncbi:MAG: hypothetical protein U0228_06905 [Myxococcaceae bacterium]